LRQCTVVRIAGDRECRELRLYERAGIDWLFVAGSRGGLAAAAPKMPGQPQRSFAETRFAAEPTKRLQTDRDAVVPAGRSPGEDHGVRERGVVVAQPVLEPEPVRRGIALVGRGELIDEAIQELRGAG